MKISFILGFPNPFAGAAWTRTHFFANDWSKQGHNVDVLGTFTPTTLKQSGSKRLANLGIYNLTFYMSSGNPFFFFLNCLMSFFSSFMFLLIKQPDIVIISVPPGDVGLGALVASKLLHKKTVVDYRDEWEAFSLFSGKNKVFYSIIKKIATFLYIKADLIVAVTRIYMYQMHSRGLLKLRLLPNGADVVTFRPRSKLALSSKTKLNLFYSGGIGSYYRLDVVIKAIKRLINNGYDIQLSMAGQGDNKQMLDLANSLGISEKIVDLGVINQKNKLNDLISSSDIGLIPYDDNPLWKNSLPAKFFEYCACGIPVIATAYSDSILAGLINNNKIGLISPPLDDVKLADMIIEFIKDESLLAKMGQNARKFVENNYDRNKISVDYLNNIKACVLQ